MPDIVSTDAQSVPIRGDKEAQQSEVITINQPLHPETFDQLANTLKKSPDTRVEFAVPAELHIGNLDKPKMEGLQRLLALSQLSDITFVSCSGTAEQTGVFISVLQRWSYKHMQAFQTQTKVT